MPKRDERTMAAMEAFARKTGHMPLFARKHSGSMRHFVSFSLRASEKLKLFRAEFYSSKIKIFEGVPINMIDGPYGPPGDEKIRVDVFWTDLGL